MYHVYTIHKNEWFSSLGWDVPENMSNYSRIWCLWHHMLLSNETNDCKNDKHKYAILESTTRGWMRAILLCARHLLCPSVLRVGPVRLPARQLQWYMVYSWNERNATIVTKLVGVFSVCLWSRSLTAFSNASNFKSRQKQGSVTQNFDCDCC